MIQTAIVLIQTAIVLIQTAIVLIHIESDVDGDTDRVE